MNKSSIFNLFLFVGFIASNLAESKAQSISDCAYDLTKTKVVYDPSYFSISYPNGDIPEEKGVCTDVVIRTLRCVGIDLQQLVHEDMKANFSAYPNLWGLSRTDSNIDHRRVPNLMRYFKRRGYSIPITNKASSYLPGDIVAWNLGGGIPI